MTIFWNHTKNGIMIMLLRILRFHTDSTKPTFSFLNHRIYCNRSKGKEHRQEETDRDGAPPTVPENRSKKLPMIER